MPSAAQQAIITAYAACALNPSAIAPAISGPTVEALAQPTVNSPITEPRPSAERCAPAAASG